MDSNKSVVLVVDDEQFNLEIINEFLSEIDIDTVCVESGEHALSLLKESPQLFSAVLLDRMMPGIDGMEVLLKIKENRKTNRMPVIMQTAEVGKEAMLEGLNAGAHYYLHKPYDKQTLIAIISTAIRDYEHYTHVQDGLKRNTQILTMMDKGKFSFKTITEGRDLVATLANVCPDPDSSILGLTELIINAIEHGNLGIGYKEKSKLNTKGQWEHEIERRLALPSYRDKYVTIEFNRDAKGITFIISDQGRGFDWKQYMKICPKRAFDNHGRGIAMANLISSSHIEYLEEGNKVCMRIPIEGVS